MFIYFYFDLKSLCKYAADDNRISIRQVTLHHRIERCTTKIDDDDDTDGNEKAAAPAVALELARESPHATLYSYFVVCAHKSNQIKQTNSISNIVRRTMCAFELRGSHM